MNDDHLHHFVVKGDRFVPLRMVDGWVVGEDKDEAVVTLGEVGFPSEDQVRV